MFNNQKDKFENSSEDNSIEKSSGKAVKSAADKTQSHQIKRFDSFGAQAAQSYNTTAAKDGAGNIRYRLLIGSSIVLIISLLSIGALARWGVLPSQNSIFVTTSEAEPSAASPAAATGSTPELSKEYIYAGSRLIAIEDAPSTATPTPTPTPTREKGERPSKGKTAT